MSHCICGIAYCRPGNLCSGCKPPVAPSPEPIPEGLVHCVDQTGKWLCWLKLTDLREALATQGLHIVDESSAKVLKHSLAWLQSDNLIDLAKNEGMMVLALRGYEAELARREKEKP